MTNLERIQKMSVDDFIIFLKYCDFTHSFPVIEGQRFLTHEELVNWFNKEEK